jgi:hypothetical protein
MPLIFLLVFVSVALTIYALVHVLKHPNYRIGNRIIWVVVVLLFSIIGPIIYFVFGKGADSETQ